jgi:HAD superfamily phosphatase (TIGR01668 family)
MSFISKLLGYLTPDFIYDSVYDIDFGALKKNNIKGLIFDIDNTLVSYNQPEPTNDVVGLMNKLKSENFEICFISNNDRQRVEQFNRNLKYLSFYKAGKPSTKFFKEAAKKMEMERGNIAVIGDQLFTDVIAAKRMKMPSVLVTPVEPVESVFFKLKRLGEKPFIKRYYKRVDKTNKTNEKSEKR